MTSTYSTVSKPRKPPKVRTILVPLANSSDSSSSEEDIEQVDAETQTNDDSQTVIEELKEKITGLEEVVVTSKFCIENVAKDNQLITFCTGFPTYESLKACYEYLGPRMNDLKYREVTIETSAMEERDCYLILMNFLVLVRLRLGLFEKDLVYHFNVSTSTTCCIC